MPGFIYPTVAEALKELYRAPIALWWCLTVVQKGGAVQASSTTWDLNQIHSTPDALTRLYVFGLLAICVWLVVTFARVRRRIPGSRFRTRARLSKFLECLANNNLSELRKYAAQFPKRAPESGLRAWTDITDDSRSQYLDLFKLAELQFRYAIRKLRGAGENLRRMMVFMLIFSAAWFCDRIANLFKGIEFTKQFPIQVFAVHLSQTFGFLLFTFFVLGFVYAVRWWFLARLDTRERYWECFAAHMRSF